MNLSFNSVLIARQVYIQPLVFYGRKVKVMGNTSMILRRGATAHQPVLAVGSYIKLLGDVNDDISTYRV